jgi:hypothetical protein
LASFAGGIGAAGATFTGIVNLNGQTFSNIVTSVNGATGALGTPIVPAGLTSASVTVLTFPSGKCFASF